MPKLMNLEDELVKAKGLVKEDPTQRVVCPPPKIKAPIYLKLVQEGLRRSIPLSTTMDQCLTEYLSNERASVPTADLDEGTQMLLRTLATLWACEPAEAIGRLLAESEPLNKMLNKALTEQIQLALTAHTKQHAVKA